MHGLKMFMISLKMNAKSCMGVYAFVHCSGEMAHILSIVSQRNCKQEKLGIPA